MKWVCLTTAPNEPIGESWTELLRKHGMPAYLRIETVTSLIAGGSQPVRLMVPEDRHEEAQALFDRLVGPWE
ncbi:MAG: hypothetical protein V3V35_02925 [Dehalococcoidia bacterium]